MKIPPLRAPFGLLLLACVTSTIQAAPDPAVPTLFRGGQAHYVAVPNLPNQAPSNLFGGEIVGDTFELFLRDVPAETVNLEIGFIDTESTASAHSTFSLSANGSPLDANLDVFAKAVGANKPWVMKTAFNHTGGPLALQFAGLSKPAFVSYVRITDAGGNVLASGIAKNWQKSERLTLLDSRSRPFHRVKVGEVPFFDVDHSPVGAWSSFIYGMSNSGGVQVCKQPGGDGTLVPDRGVMIAVKNGTTERLMPFASAQKSLADGALVTDKEVTRTLGACTDNWTIPLGVS